MHDVVLFQQRQILQPIAALKVESRQCDAPAVALSVSENSLDAKNWVPRRLMRVSTFAISVPSPTLATSPLEASPLSRSRTRTMIREQTRQQHSNCLCDGGE